MDAIQSPVLRARIRELRPEGVLPERPPKRVVAAPSRAANPCAGCATALALGEPVDQVLRLHHPCLNVWHEQRGR